MIRTSVPASRGRVHDPVSPDRIKLPTATGPAGRVGARTLRHAQPLGLADGDTVIVQGRTPPRRAVAQPRFTAIGARFLCASDTKHGPLAHLALRHHSHPR